MPQLFSADMCDNAASDTPAGTGRFTRPQELADVELLLGSGRDGNLTGSDMFIDGGLVQIL
jgi:hypothetical protein